MEVEVNGKKYTLKEIKYLDGVDIEETRQKQGTRAAMKKMMLLSGVPEEDAENLSLKDGAKLQQEINKVSGLVDFQNPVEEKEQSQK